MTRATRLPVVFVLIGLLTPLLLGACGKTIGETIDDAAITARVKTALLNDAQVGGLRIDVDTTKGVVSLSGIVRSAEEERKAVELARRVNGVADVRSTLQVVPEKK